MFLILEQREVHFAVAFLLQQRNQTLRIVMVVRAHGNELRRLAGRVTEQRFQLNELFYAEGSPMAAIKNQNHIFVFAELRKGNRRSFFIL